MIPEPISKITIVGNAGGGKTLLSRKLSKIHDLPVIHVDAVQFQPGMKIRPQDETRNILLEFTNQEKWIVDGYGPLDLIEKRFQLTDRIVFVDFPIWRHFWWCSKRQIQSLWTRRSELPENCNEATWAHTRKLFKTLWQVHTKMRPELLRIFQREQFKNKVIYIQNMKQWNQFFQDGIS